MSALTEPSPTTSPSSAFHIQRPSPTTFTTPRISPKNTFLAPSPRRVFNAPTTSRSSSSYVIGGSSVSRPPHREHYIESPAIEKRPTFVDAGTQYSPDGFPPTAGRRVTAVAGQQRPGVSPSVDPTTPPSAGKKRKSEDTHPISPEPMSTSEASSSSIPADPPPEPQPRLDPPSSVQASSSTGVASSSTAANEEPQEARSTGAVQSSNPKRSRYEPEEVKVMPLLYQNCDPKELGNLISNMLLELIRLNDRIPLRDGRLTRFHSRAPPGISVSDYLQRLIHHATLSPPILLSMVWYIDRLCQMYSAFTINSLTVHRFLITAATVAAKGLSDSFWTNPVYARIGGIPVSELATLELEFLTKVAWKIVPKPEVLEDYYRSLVERTDGYELEPSSTSEAEPAPASGSGSTSVESSDEDEEEKEDEEMGENNET